MDAAPATRVKTTSVPTAIATPVATPVASTMSTASRECRARRSRRQEEGTHAHTQGS
jgi:hypothetical protein